MYVYIIYIYVVKYRVVNVCSTYNICSNILYTYNICSKAQSSKDRNNVCASLVAL